MMTDTLKEYNFTDEQIVFLMQIVRDNAQYEDTEDREWMEDLANQIEDQIVNHPTNSWIKITLTTEQFSTLVENYVSHIVDWMDVESLECMVYDLLLNEYKTYTEEEILGEIKELYGEEVAADLLEEWVNHPGNLSAI